MKKLLLIKSIDFKLVFMYGLVVVFLTITNMIITSHYYREHIEREEDYLSSMVTGALAESINNINYVGKYHVRKFLDEIIVKYPIVDSISVIDKYGIVIASTNQSLNGTTIKNFIFEGDIAKTKHILHKKEDKEYYIMPFIEHYTKEISGQIEIVISEEKINEISILSMNRIYVSNIVLAFIGFVLVMIISSYFSKSIRKNFDLLNDVTDSTSDLIYYKDTSHKFLGCNSAFASYLKLNKNQIIGFDSFSLNQSNYKELNADEELVIKSAKRITKEVYLDIDGKKTTLLKQISPLIDKNSNIYGIVTISRDITEKYILEAELSSKNRELKELNENLELRVAEEFNKRNRQQQILVEQAKLISMGEMMANISHQWRQPLNQLSLSIQRVQKLLIKKELDPNNLDDAVKNSMKIIKNMSHTIDDFINFFKPVTKEDIFDVKDVILESISIVDSSLKHFYIKLETTLQDNMKIMGFGNQFSQVLINLINNAKDVLVEREIKDPIIKIFAYKKDDINYIEVMDNGGGIKDDILPKIFEPYFTTKDSRGTGIGLYMSKIIIEENMKGTLNAKNIENRAVFSIKIKDNLS